MKRHQHQVELYPTSLRIWPAGPQVFQNGSLLTLLRQQLLRRPLRRQHGQLCLDHLQLLLNHWMLLGSIYGIVSCNANLKSQRQHTKKSKFTCSKRCRKFDSGSGKILFLGMHNFPFFDFCCGFGDNSYFSSFGPKDLSILIFSFSMILLSIAIFLAIENDAANRRTMDNINLFDNKIILLSDDYARKFWRYLSALIMILKSLSRALRDGQIIWPP